MIAGILLAAGASRRFGAPKLLEDLDGKPVIRWSAEALARARLDESIVVVGPDFRGVQDGVRAGGLDARFVMNPDPERGMGSSIASGVGALDARVAAAVIALGDAPTLDVRAYQCVVDRYRAGDVSIVVPTYGGVRGHPVLFDRSVFHELQALSGDTGARSVVEAEATRVAFVEMGLVMPIDIDTPADLARLRSGAHFMAPLQTKRP